MGNKIEYGVEKVHIWVIESEVNGEVTYAEDAIKVPGAVALKLSPLGDATTIYADNTAYFTISSNNGYEGEWESFQIPEDIQTKILGLEKDSNGALIEKADARLKSFGMSYQFIGDTSNAKVFAPYCSLTQRPSDEKTTKGESVDPSAYTLQFNMAPRPSDKVVRVKIYEDSPSYENFFEAPYSIGIVEPESPAEG